MSTNFLRAVTCHQTNDDRASHWRSDDPHSEMVMFERAEHRRESLEKDDIGNFGDEPQQRLGHEGADHPNRQSQANENKQARVSAEIA